MPTDHTVHGHQPTETEIAVGRPAGQSDPSSELPGEFGRLLVLLPVHSHRLVLDAEGVREVVTVGQITALPESTPALRGAVAVRGALLPLYDVTGWCGGEPFDPATTARFGTILSTASGSYAIETVEHPTIATSADPIHHKQPVVIGDQVCIGVAPDALLQDLNAAGANSPATAPIVSAVPSPDALNQGLLR